MARYKKDGLEISVDLEQSAAPILYRYHEMMTDDDHNEDGGWQASPFQRADCTDEVDAWNMIDSWEN